MVTIIINNHVLYSNNITDVYVMTFVIILFIYFHQISFIWFWYVSKWSYRYWNMHSNASQLTHVPHVIGFIPLELSIISDYRWWWQWLFIKLTLKRSKSMRFCSSSDLSVMFCFCRESICSVSDLQTANHNTGYTLINSPNQNTSYTYNISERYFTKKLSFLNLDV